MILAPLEVFDALLRVRVGVVALVHAAYLRHQRALVGPCVM